MSGVSGCLSGVSGCLSGACPGQRLGTPSVEPKALDNDDVGLSGVLRSCGFPPPPRRDAAVPDGGSTNHVSALGALKGTRGDTRWGSQVRMRKSSLRNTKCSHRSSLGSVMDALRGITKLWKSKAMRGHLRRLWRACLERAKMNRGSLVNLGLHI